MFVAGGARCAFRACAKLARVPELRSHPAHTMTEASLQTALRASDDVVFRELDGEAVILNLGSGIYFGLDPIGTRMWQLIEQHGRLEAVLADLRDEYDAPPDTLARDLLRLAAELMAKGLLEVDARGAGA